VADRYKVAPGAYVVNESGSTPESPSMKRAAKSFAEEARKRLEGKVVRYKEDAMTEKEAVSLLGKAIGFGRVMQLATECWGGFLVNSGNPTGGEFVSGPCKALVTPCQCQKAEGYVACDWCEGCGWVTKKVKDLQEG